jgi:hypothetical protein
MSGEMLERVAMAEEETTDWWDERSSRERLVAQGPTVIRAALREAASRVKTYVREAADPSGSSAVPASTPEPSAAEVAEPEPRIPEPSEPLASVISGTASLAEELAARYEDGLASELIDCFAEDDPDVRVLAALQCLAADLREEKVLGPLMLLASNDEDLLVRVAACFSLFGLERTSQQVRETAGHVLELFRRGALRPAFEMAAGGNGADTETMIWRAVAAR